MSKHGAVTVTEVQTPDLHISVGRAGGDEGAVLVDRNTRSGLGSGTVGQDDLMTNTKCTHM